MDGPDLGGLWIVFWIVFFILIVPKWRHAVVPRVVPPVREAIGRLRSTMANGGPGGAGHDPAMTILRERYARGEIDRAEYEARRDVLTGNGSTDTWRRV